MDALPVHVVLADTKKNAYFLTNDFYSFFSDDCIYYYPSPTDKSEIKEITAKVRRTATISALTHFKEPLMPPGTTKSGPDHLSSTQG